MTAFECGRGSARHRTGSSGFRRGERGARLARVVGGGVLSRPPWFSVRPGPVLALHRHRGRTRLPQALSWAGAVVAAVVGFLGAAPPSRRGRLLAGGCRAPPNTPSSRRGFRRGPQPDFHRDATTLAGLTLLAPTVVTAAAWLCLLVAVELQVRLVESLPAEHPPTGLRLLRRSCRPVHARSRPTSAPHPGELTP
ncbi:isoprenylcysteine carboxylmethyltransferase family protein [Kocuria rhizophila]|nr:isoprenylcysteine carboxylmethyltransferase family protein [Kocuria rhizophila]